MQFSNFNLTQIKKHCDHRLLLCIVAGVILSGCSNQNVSNGISSTDHRVTLSQDRHIKLKMSDAALEEEESDLWERMRQRFKLQQDYGSHSKLIAQYKQQFISNKRSTEQLLERGSPYLYYIASELEKRDMPMELALLPAIESAYTPTAYSSQRAAGLWQFMPITAKHFNLQQNQWYDARLDVVASTNAALDYLQYLYNMFDDWPLALAAYNSGEGTVRKAINLNKRQNLPTSYWDLKLPKETQAYVPKLLALSEIAFAPSQHGIKIEPVLDSPYFELVELNKQTKLATVSNLVGITHKEFVKLNAAYLQEAVVAEHSPSTLLVPVSYAKKLSNLIAAGSIPEEKIKLWIEYKIKRGDTLSMIAKNHRTTVKELTAMNKLSSNYVLRAGSDIKIPISNSMPYNTANSNTQLARNKKYIVKSGDSLWTISQKNNIKLEKLLKLNKLTASSSIKPGQQIYITENN